MSKINDIYKSIQNDGRGEEYPGHYIASSRTNILINDWLSHHVNVRTMKKACVNLLNYSLHLRKANRKWYCVDKNRPFEPETYVYRLTNSIDYKWVDCETMCGQDKDIIKGVYVCLGPYCASNVCHLSKAEIKRLNNCANYE